jgi:hypothetical protein
MKDEPILLAYKTGDRLEVFFILHLAEACLPLQFLVSLFIITTMFIVHCFRTCKCLLTPVSVPVSVYCPLFQCL